MGRILPDEILVKIITECIEPYSVTMQSSNKSSVLNPHDQISLTGPGPIINLKLTNRMFCEEVTRILQSKFNGELEILEGLRSLAISDLPAFLMSQLRILKTNSQMVDGGFASNHLISLLDTNALPNLQGVYLLNDSSCKVSKFSTPVSESWKTWSSGGNATSHLKLTFVKVCKMRNLHHSLYEKNIRLVFEYIVAIKGDQMVQLDIDVNYGGSLKQGSATITRRTVLPLPSRLIAHKVVHRGLKCRREYL